MADGVAVGGVYPEGEGNMKFRKVYFVSGTRKNCYLWQFVCTREDLNRSNRMEFNNSVKALGVADDAGSYAFLDEFGNTFRSFFFAFDNQDLSAAILYSKTVRKHNNSSCFLF